MHVILLVRLVYVAGHHDISNYMHIGTYLKFSALGGYGYTYTGWVIYCTYATWQLIMIALKGCLGNCYVLAKGVGTWHSRGMIMNHPWPALPNHYQLQGTHLRLELCTPGSWLICYVCFAPVEITLQAVFRVLYCRRAYHIYAVLTNWCRGAQCTCTC